MGSFPFASIKRGASGALFAALIILPSLSKADAIYAGFPKEQAGIETLNWGSGSATDYAEKKFIGERSIKIITQGMYAGGGIEFKSPVSLNVGDAASNQYLQ